jgi:hypothetical protein
MIGLGKFRSIPDRGDVKAVRVDLAADAANWGEGLQVTHAIAALAILRSCDLYIVSVP